MEWLWIIAGLLTLLSACLLTILLRRTPRDSRKSAAYELPRMPLAHTGNVSRLVRRIIRTSVHGKDVEALQEAARPLVMHLSRLDREIRRVPPLPADSEGEPRLMNLARDIGDGDAFTAEVLADALSGWNGTPLSAMEISAFSQCVGAAACQRLSSVLRAMKKDLRERSGALRLARRLQRCKRPDEVLRKNHLSSVGLAALLGQIQQGKNDQLLSLVEVWLTQHEIAPEALTQSGMQRQIRLAEEIRRALACFAALERLNWLEHCAQADELHTLLLNDPSGVYERMTAGAQLALRLQIDSVSRHVRLSPTELVRHAFLLCSEAEERSLEGYVGYWFQAQEGLIALHKALPTRRGWLYARFALRQEQLAYAGLWVFGLITGMAFLQARQPVFMLPFFALTMGTIIRHAFDRQDASPLPAMKIIPGARELRTLVVLHAEMADAHEAIQAVHRLKAALHAFPAEQADLLLLGDFSPSITAVSSNDYAIVQAASSAVAALDEGGRVAYLQRGRAWDSSAHRYRARAGLRGAITAVSRLIAQGECEDLIAFSTVEAARLERKYAYVLALPADRQPAHGLLERLLSVMAHPMCQRYPTPKGYRGFSMLLPEEDPSFSGAALIRPDAFLEATDEVLPAFRPCDALSGELAGQARVPGAHVQKAREDPSWDAQYRRAIRAWRLARWQLPWVRTPLGVVGNPLGFGARFRLRERLRWSLVPLAQLVLLWFSVLTQNWLLLAIALLAPEIGIRLRRREDWLKLLCRLSLLPMRGAVSAAAVVQLLRRKASSTPAWATLEVWVQGLTATVMGALAFVLPVFAVPAFGLTLLFACFPLAHRFLDMPISPAEPLTDEHIALMDNASSAIWRFFSRHVSAETRHVPPCTVQFEPPVGEESVTSPEAMGGYLVACLCAKELGFLSAREAAIRIRQTAASLDALSMPFGLPCRRYALPSLTVVDARVDAASAGFLLASLLTTAQALRTWLAELPPEYAGLSAEVSHVAHRFDLTRLFDEDAMLFHEGLDRDGQGTGYITVFSDEALLLSVGGCALGMIPPEHLSRLARVRVALREGDAACSRHGTASEHLLAGLFLPMDEQEIRAFIRSMERTSQDGLFGQDACRYAAYDPALRYRQAIFGIPEIAVSGCDVGPVFAPHAAALCLPWLPHRAVHALERFQKLGALGPEGFCDAVDFSREPALVGLHDSFHQSVTLAALTHMLADSPLRRYFCALPEVEACLPLLTLEGAPLILPRLPMRKPQSTEVTEAAAPIPQLTLPAEGQLLGTEDFHLAADANGCSVIFHGCIPLTRGPEEAEGLYGIQFYLADEGHLYRLGHAVLPGSVTFAPGEIRYEQLCGSLRAELVCTADTIHERAIHVLTITNLSTRDRLVDVADIVLPDLNQPTHVLEAARPENSHLTLHARGTDITLHHAFAAAPSPLALHICTDADAFRGRSASLHQPAALEEPAADLTNGLSPCLSFRAKVGLGGRGQAILWFTTSLRDAPCPSLAEISGIRHLAALQDGAIRETAALTDAQALCARRLVGAALFARGRIAVLLETAEDGRILDDLTPISRWFSLHGMALAFSLFGPESSLERIREDFSALLAEGCFRLGESSELARFRIILRGDLPLAEQLEALYQPFTPPDPEKPPRPALLPEKELLHRHLYGGFDPQTDDYILQLEPRQTTPVPWWNRHLGRYFAETVDESGFRAPFGEQVWLTLADGTRLSPWAPELARSVRMGPGQTSWEAWSDVLDLRLSAAPLPDQRAGLRVLSLRNATEQALTVRVTVLARLGSDVPLECAPGVVITDRPQLLQAFIAGNHWAAGRTSAFAEEAVAAVPPLNGPDRADGRTAQLSCDLTLPPHASGQAVWLAGYARHGEDVARALDQIRQCSTSSVLREARAFWAQQLDSLTLTAPEQTMNLLMNRLLPMQALSAGGLDAVPVQIYLAPPAARRSLLAAARIARSREEWLRISLLSAQYHRVTQDGGLWDAYLPHQGDTLFGCCTQALLTLPLDDHDLPLENDPARTCFLAALAAAALTEAQPSPFLQALHRRLLNAADTYLWEDGCYGNPLRLDVQAYACLAYGANVRTRQAMHRCWAVLYDQPNGLIRRQMPTDASVLPGLPENGGMVTADAVLCLRALLMTDHTEEAIELLRALNPLHHTDDPVRQENFRGAPYLLPGGMTASPLEAGRALAEGGDRAAGCLYAAILAEVLGFRREGQRIRLSPRVPGEWEDFTLTLRDGASTWRISAERSVRGLIIDGEECADDQVLLHDDGKIHRVHFPMK